MRIWPKRSPWTSTCNTFKQRRRERGRKPWNLDSGRHLCSAEYLVSNRCIPAERSKAELWHWKRRYCLDRIVTKQREISEVMIHACVLYMNLRKRFRFLLRLFFKWTPNSIQNRLEKPILALRKMAFVQVMLVIIFSVPMPQSENCWQQSANTGKSNPCIGSRILPFQKMSHVSSVKMPIQPWTSCANLRLQSTKIILRLQVKTFIEGKHACCSYPLWKSPWPFRFFMRRAWLIN